MSYSTLQKYVHGIVVRVPWTHWMVISILSFSLIVFLLIRWRRSAYGAICLGFAVFVCLVLLDTAVVNRLNSIVHPESGFSLAAEFRRLTQGGAARWTEMLANVAVFVPFGFFLSEFLSATKRFDIRRRVGLATLYAFGLSLLIESLQLILRLGVFEITDLVMNTVGAFIGTGMSVGWRKLVGFDKKESAMSFKIVDRVE